MAAEHITIRDLRPSYGSPEVFAAQCSSCGWVGPEHRGAPGADRNAAWDGKRHIYDEARKPK